MDVVYPRCAGLDIHKKTVVACVIVPSSKGKPHKTIKTFGTMTDDLVALGDWLAEQQATHVAMESTGVFWQPIWNLLEDRFVLLLINAHHIKQVPGRKTDVADSEWIADLLRHGLLRASFVPDRTQRELRELTRYRTSLMQERAAEVNRLQKTLEGANIKLAAVATDVLGKSGRESLEALVAGTNQAGELAQLAKGRMRAKIPELQRALAGSFRPHHQFMVARHLAYIDAIDEIVAQVSGKIAERLRPAEADVELLDAITGIGRPTAEVWLAEVGSDLERFPTHRHLASWAGMCPGNNESAGKRKTGKTRKGNAALRTALVVAAQAASHKRDSYLSVQYRRLAARRGPKKAIVALAHSLLVIAYHVLKRRVDFTDLGPAYFDERNRVSTQRQLVRRLERMGYKVALEPMAA
ncbi:MAG: IS110 family transposase [Chloroflexi bacterium]|nr:IS110 family transposase [Chloroflexota bacterium]